MNGFFLYIYFVTICVCDRTLPSIGSEALFDKCTLPVSSELLSVKARQFLRTFVLCLSGAVLKLLNSFY